MADNDGVLETLEERVARDTRERERLAERTRTLRAVSGGVDADSRLVAFLYVLMRDVLSAGKVETLVHLVQKNGHAFTNGWLAQYAMNLAGLLGWIVGDIVIDDAATFDDRLNADEVNQTMVATLCRWLRRADLGENGPPKSAVEHLARAGELWLTSRQAPSLMWDELDPAAISHACQSIRGTLPEGQRAAMGVEPSSLQVLAKLGEQWLAHRAHQAARGVTS